MRYTLTTHQLIHQLMAEHFGILMYKENRFWNCQHLKHLFILLDKKLPDFLPVSFQQPNTKKLFEWLKFFFLFESSLSLRLRQYDARWNITLCMSNHWDIALSLQWRFVEWSSLWTCGSIFARTQSMYQAQNNILHTEWQDVAVGVMATYLTVLWVFLWQLIG